MSASTQGDMILGRELTSQLEPFRSQMSERVFMDLRATAETKLLDFYDKNKSVGVTKDDVTNIIQESRNELSKNTNPSLPTPQIPMVPWQHFKEMHSFTDLTDNLNIVWRYLESLSDYWKSLHEFNVRRRHPHGDWRSHLDD